MPEAWVVREGHRSEGHTFKFYPQVSHDQERSRYDASARPVRVSCRHKRGSDSSLPPTILLCTIIHISNDMDKVTIKQIIVRWIRMSEAGTMIWRRSRGNTIRWGHDRERGIVPTSKEIVNSWRRTVGGYYG